MIERTASTIILGNVSFQITCMTPNFSSLISLELIHKKALINLTVSKSFVLGADCETGQIIHWQVAGYYTRG